MAALPPLPGPKQPIPPGHMVSEELVAAAGAASAAAAARAPAAPVFAGAAAAAAPGDLFSGPWEEPSGLGDLNWGVDEVSA